MKTMLLSKGRAAAAPGPRMETGPHAMKLSASPQNSCWLGPDPPTDGVHVSPLVDLQPAAQQTHTLVSIVFFTQTAFSSYLHYWQTIMRRRKSGRGSGSHRGTFLSLFLCLDRFGRTDKGTVQPIAAEIVSNFSPPPILSVEAVIDIFRTETVSCSRHTMYMTLCQWNTSLNWITGSLDLKGYLKKKKLHPLQLWLSLQSPSGFQSP